MPEADRSGTEHDALVTLVVSKHDHRLSGGTGLIVQLEVVHLLGKTRLRAFVHVVAAQALPAQSRRAASPTSIGATNRAPASRNGGPKFQ